MAEMVLALPRFLSSSRFKAGPDAIYGKALGLFHAGEKHTEVEWLDLITALKTRPHHTKRQSVAIGPSQTSAHTSARISSARFSMRQR